MKNEPLTVYSNEGCVQCTATMRALEAAGIEFEVVDLSTDREALARLKAAGFLQAPVVETVDQSWSGFRPDKIDDVAKKRAAR
ncbi:MULTISPECIES: glutaredoxin-like protein NrdH [Microbacterium]|uniref:glutaredoxin-like protein NrdH n=1 Tax=Microbacterium TaxID=33882 RepID=UPI00344F0A3A